MVYSNFCIQYEFWVGVPLSVHVDMLCVHIQLFSHHLSGLCHFFSLRGEGVSGVGQLVFKTIRIMMHPDLCLRRISIPPLRVDVGTLIPSPIT